MNTTTELGQGFQIAAIAGGRIVETLYWRAPSGECFTTGERRFDLVNFDKPGQVWHRVGYQLDDAELEFIGNYPRPYGCKLSA